MNFIFAELPFLLKGHVLSFISDYVFRKGRMNEVFIRRIPREKIAEVKYLFEKTQRVMTWKKGIIWRSYIEFSEVSPIWRIIRQNYKYLDEEDDEKMITPEIFCYYERSYMYSNNIYQTPIV